MYLQYGDLSLAVIDLNRYERTNVYDASGTDLLYVRVVVGVSAVYAPGGIPHLTSATSITQDTQATLTGTDNTRITLTTTPRGVDPSGSNFLTTPPALETDLPGNVFNPVASQYTGAETDADLRFRLLYPRQSLILWAADRRTGALVRWLESPRPGFMVDCKNGPKPISCDIITADGEVAAGMFYQIETCVQPCPAGSDRLVTSHRWKMTHTHDANNYLTRVIEGTIVFNSEVVYLLSISPDWVRNQFLHPVPLGYQRRVPSISISEDGLTITYVITDTDPTIVFEPGDSGATAIQIIENMELVYPSPRVARVRESFQDEFDRRGLKSGPE